LSEGKDLPSTTAYFSGPGDRRAQILRFARGSQIESRSYNNEIMKLRTVFRWFGCLAFCGVIAVALASGKAADLLKSINDYRASLFSQAQEKAKADSSKVDIAAIQKQVQAKAVEAINGVDPAKVDPAETLEWAQIFNLAGRPKDSQTMLTTFIGTKPEDAKLYQAQSMLLSMSSVNRDLKTVAATLQAMKPFDTASSLSFASYATSYAPRIAGEIGADAAISLIDKALAGVKQAELSDVEKTRFAGLQNSGLQRKIEIYKDAGQKDKALALLDDAIKTAPEKTKASFVTLRNQLVLVGAAAPALKTERGYGEFKGLEALKGKVVVLDFFAHWCGPCKAAFPSMRQMYAELQPKGLEVVGVTTYYGYIGDRTVTLTPDQEYTKMADFVKDQNMTWPIVFGGRDNFQAYGVTAIPHVVVIGRDGVVHHLDIGYSPQLFEKFRKDVEALLAEK
jgi:thiol-disulfide isomerase/thioredoxin